MMEPTNNNPNNNGNIELSDVGATVTGAPSVDETVESSMDVEQPLPTVAELRGKSDNEDTVRPRRAAFCMLYALPFLVVTVVVIVVAVVTTQKNKAAYEANLRNMDHDIAFNSVVEYLGNHDVSGLPELVREGSYQNQAAKWMAHGDEHSNQIPKESPASKEGYSFIQRYIMALLYYQMGGPKWKYDVNFLRAENTCEWSSWIVRSDYNTIPMGAICNNNDLLSALVFVGADVKGSFPTELAKLTTLRVIEMDVNEITGSIPQAFHTLTNLENLHLSHNQLTGTLGSYLGSFNKLVSIDVSFNMMEGTLPTELGTVDMLRGIAVDHNLFHGTPNFWGQSRATAGQKQEALEYLFLENNAFEGFLEETMIEKVPNLVALDISDNQFKGGIPPNLFLLKQLQVLDLHDNVFTGPIPHGIPSNTALQFLALHKNELSGRIGEEFGNLQVLRHFDVSNNKLTGYDMNEQTGFGLPAMKQLTYLFLAANEFPAGPIPDWVRNMKQLEELSFKSLNLDGTIPTWFGELSNLILLDLDDNDLRGTIPTEFGNMKSLQFLLLNRNELTEQIPVELADLNLRVLYLDKNYLEGDMEMFCKRADIFNPIIVADCGGTNPEVQCDCCRKCCVDGEKCNDDNIVPSNDPLWQFGYDRVIYSFGNYTGFFWASPP